VAAHRSRLGPCSLSPGARLVAGQRDDELHELRHVLLDQHAALLRQHAARADRRVDLRNLLDRAHEQRGPRVRDRLPQAMPGYITCIAMIFSSDLRYAAHSLTPITACAVLWRRRRMNQPPRHACCCAHSQRVPRAGARLAAAGAGGHERARHLDLVQVKLPVGAARHARPAQPALSKPTHVVDIMCTVTTARMTLPPTNNVCKVLGRQP
jgi:hypothetical protein